jgi:hypothetical protein
MGQMGETTGEQNPGGRGDHNINRWGPPMPYGSMAWGNAGNADNPMGFPNYGYLYTGTYSVYRWMLQHPILRLVRAIAVADILCNRWEYAGEDATDDEIKLVQENMDWLRINLVEDYYVRGRDFGWYGGEMIWEIRGATTWLERVKPLLVDVTEILVDPRGNYSGLLNSVPTGTPPVSPPTSGSTGFYPDQGDVPYSPSARLAAPYKSFKYTYDSEAGYNYGRSWLENVRMTAWRDWLDCAQQLQRLGAKITGIQLILTSPAGTFPGPTVNGVTQTMSYKEHCLNIINSLAAGAPGAWLPALNLGIDGKTNRLDTAKIIAELANKSVIGCELLNHGTNTPAIEGLLSRMKHDEELMFAGGLKSPRTGMPSEHGGKADAEAHTDTGTKMASVEDIDFAKACQPMVDAILVLNKGITRRRKVHIVAPTIANNKRMYFKALLLAAMNDPSIAEEMMRVMDVNKELEYAEIQLKKGETYNPDRITQARQDAAGGGNGGGNGGGGLSPNRQPEGGRPTDGGGNPKARPQPSRSGGNGSASEHGGGRVSVVG